MNEPTLEPEFKAFKNGVYDAIIHGAPHFPIEEGYSATHYYKRGYDFGMTVYSDLLEEEE